MILHTFDVLFLPDFTFLVFRKKYDFLNNHFYHKKHDFAQFLRSSSFLILLFYFSLWKNDFLTRQGDFKKSWFLTFLCKNSVFRTQRTSFCLPNSQFEIQFLLLFASIRMKSNKKNTKTHRRFLFLFPLKSTKNWVKHGFWAFLWSRQQCKIYKKHVFVFFYKIDFCDLRTKTYTKNCWFYQFFVMHFFLKIKI